MFTWWKRRPANRGAVPRGKSRLHVEVLETRACPALVTNVGPNIDINQAVGNQREQCIVINPLHPNQVAAFSNIEDIDGDGTGDVGIAESWSTDGGITWNTQYLFTDPNSTDASFGDPQAVWDNFGHIYLTYLNQDTDVVIATSIDGGATFTTRIVTTDGAAGTGGHDQPSIAVGPGPQPGTEALWISVNTSMAAPGQAHIDVLSAVIIKPGILGYFTQPVQAPGSNTVDGNFGDIAVGPNGQVVVTYQNGSGNLDGPSIIWVNIDPDGMGPLPFGTRIIASTTNVGPDRGPGPAGSIIFPAQSNNFGIDAEANLAWDRSNGPHRGRLYLVYVDAPTAVETDLNSNIFLRYSDDGGRTWSVRQQINDDTGSTSQFNPAIAVDQSTGNVGIAWYDARNDPTNNRRAEVFATVSDDGGTTFKPNFKVSAGVSESRLAEPPSSGVRPLGFGDFNKIDFVQGNLQIVWADNSTTLLGNPDPPHMDTATARVRVLPMLKVRVYFPTRWTVLNAAAGTYKGQLTIVNLSGVNLFGPLQVTIVLPDASLNFLSPTNTRVGNTVTFTINQNLPKNQSIRVNTILANPLHKKLPTFVIGYVRAVG